MTGGISAVATRMAELRQLVTPTAPASATSAATVTASTAATSAASTGTSFAAALAALGIDASGLTGLTASTGTASTGTATTGTTTLASASGVTGQDLVAAAQAYTGVPYVWGGETLDEGGLDCSGLVQRSLADLGITGVPRVARDQMTLGTAVPSLDQALPGDLLVFGGGSHIAIYMGDGTMIDAPKPGGSVAVRDVYTAPTAIRRILPQESASATETVAGAAAAAAAASDAQLAVAVATASAQRTALGLVTGLTTTTSATTDAAATDSVWTAGLTTSTALDAATWAVAS